jgi:hypothetical protein
MNLTTHLPATIVIHRRMLRRRTNRHEWGIPITHISRLHLTQILDLQYLRGLQYLWQLVIRDLRFARVDERDDVTPDAVRNAVDFQPTRTTLCNIQPGVKLNLNFTVARRTTILD